MTTYDDQQAEAPLPPAEDARSHFKGVIAMDPIYRMDRVGLLIMMVMQTGP